MPVVAPIDIADTVGLEALLDARLECDEDGCTAEVAWLCRCPFDGCEYRLHLCEEHTATARQIVLELLANPRAFVGCPRCMRRYPRQGPFRRWVHL